MTSISDRRLFRRRRSTDPKWAPTRWSLWSAPRPVLVWVLAIDTVAAVLIVATARLIPVESDDVVRFAILAVGSALHIEGARNIERLRRVAAEGVPYVNLKGMWTFAGAVVLPPTLAVALIATTYLHSWIRFGRAAPYRAFFSASTVVLGSGAAALIVGVLSPTGYPGYPAGPLGLLTIVLAALAYWFVNYALVVLAIIISNPAAPGGNALGRFSDQLIVGGALGLGAAVSALIMHEPWSVVVLLVTVLGLHRALLLGQFQTLARTDGKTGLANATFWYEVAEKQLAHAKQVDQPLGVLFVDLDYFKAINDTHGHLAGDEALKAIAHELRRDIRTDDFVGRLGGEEFAILLPGTGGTDLRDTAERIRLRVAEMSVEVSRSDGKVTLHGLTCSIGAASFPECGDTLQDLLLAADTAAYAAKAAGRNKVELAPGVAD
jgi:diguanylate cyclase (GGDEF)-like protein